MVAFTGDIDGGLYIYGSLDKPQMHGDIVLDSVSVYARQAGARYWFDNRPVQIKDNQLIFDKFAIYTTSKNPFTIDGKVDFRNMERPTANLNLLAENYTLLDAPRTRESLVYGKVFVDLHATVKGPLDGAHDAWKHEFAGQYQRNLRVDRFPFNGGRPSQRAGYLYLVHRYDVGKSG